MIGTCAVLAALLLGYCLGRKPTAPVPAQEETVWTYIARTAPEQGLSPHFVYALAMAESSLDPLAETHVARGILQMTEPAWSEVAGDVPYRKAWNWQTNITMGMRYLVLCREFLVKEHGSWSYPLIAACYRYGMYRVRDVGFELKRLPRPRNKIYRELFRGNVAPVPTPAGGDIRHR